MTRLLERDRPPVTKPEDVVDGAVLTIFRVPKEMAGMRVDVFIQTQLRDTSRTRAKMIVKAAARNLDGRPIRANARVAAEQLIALWRPPWDEEEVPTDIPILYCDEHIIVIDKPAGLPVHPSARYYRNTVIKILERSFPSPHLVLVHRLDRDTSGVLVLARTPEADRKIKAQLEARAGVEKSYLAISWNVPTELMQRVAVPLERDPTARMRVLMRVAEPGTGLEAATRVEIIEKRRRGARQYALLRCDLETGRQHQIRVHLKSIGCPVVGDKLYGPDSELHARASDGVLTEEDRAILELPRHALHAHRMSFVHPITGERITSIAQLPRDMSDFFDSLEPQVEMSN
jgi:23S rRNA pseudouridine1911/1915/1917 synthase